MSLFNGILTKYWFFIEISYFHKYLNEKANAQADVDGVKYEIDLSLIEEKGEDPIIEARISPINHQEGCYEDSRRVYINGNKITQETAKIAMAKYLH